MKSSLLAEIRDWIAFSLTGIFSYLTWRWRPKRDRNRRGRHHVIHLADSVKVSDAVDLNLSPVHGKGSISLALTTGTNAGTQATLDSMAEVFPYEFPSN